MKFENTEVFNFEGALRGMRNPMDSWARSDSIIDDGRYVIGKNDLQLAQNLISAGSEHSKYLRMISICVDITAPIYWWKEFDTYKVATVSNSTSTMHKIQAYPITKDCFECPDLIDASIVNLCEKLRQEYNATKDKEVWKKLIVNLPESWLQKRTITMNYATLRNIIHQRKAHKLTEWSIDFISWTKSLPYSEELLWYKQEETK